MVVAPVYCDLLPATVPSRNIEVHQAMENDGPKEEQIHGDVVTTRYSPSVLEIYIIPYALRLPC